MSAIKVFINLFTTITSVITIVCAVNMAFVPDYDVPNAVLWQVLLSGFVTALLTFFGIKIFWGTNSKIKLIILGVIHYILMCAVMIGFGTWFDWMNFDVKGIAMMTISVAVVYLVTLFMNYIIIKKEADDINSALEEYNNRQK